MALGPRLDLRQSQSLVMTPQLQQAIKLLALSNLELEAYLAEALEGNPLLDATPGDREPGDDEGGDEAPPSDGPPADTDLALSSEAGTADDLDVDFAEERFHHDSASDSVGLSGDGEGIDFDSFAGDDGTLYDHLLAQVGERFSGIEAMVAEQIVALIDEAGYLRADLAELRSGSACRSRWSRRCSRASRASTLRASAAATSPNASRSRRARPTATIPPWRR